MTCPNCSSSDTTKEATHHSTHEQPGTSYGCDFSVDEYICNSCGERFADRWTMLRLHFENVGRGKKSWFVDCENIDAITDRLVMGQIRKSKALMSRDIEWNLYIQTGKGSIYAGGRPVGTLRIQAI